MEARHAFLEVGTKEHRCMECPKGSPERLTGLADFAVLQSGLIHGTDSGQCRSTCGVARLFQRWLPGSRLDRVLFAPVLIVACARSAWARGVFSIKDGLVAPCGGRQLV